MICPGATVGMRYGVGDGVETPGDGAIVGGPAVGMHEGTRQHESSGSVTMVHPAFVW